MSGALLPIGRQLLFRAMLKADDGAPICGEQDCMLGKLPVFRIDETEPRRRAAQDVYLTAQRVRDQQGQEGINAFLYVHRLHWDVPPPEIPDDNPGELACYTESSVAPGGNVVRSYLDIVAADQADWAEVHDDFVRFLSWTQTQPLPWDGIAGQCRFRFGMDADLVPHWRSELATLYGAGSYADEHGAILKTAAKTRSSLAKNFTRSSTGFNQPVVMQ